MRLAILIEEAEAIAGGTRALARMLQCSAGNVSDWKAGRRPCPEEMQLRLAAIAGREPVKTVLEVAAERLGKLARSVLAGTLAALVLVGSGAPGAAGWPGLFRTRTRANV
jgi:DNA-binding transcriptional regulator YdaS (Cro superfamily)